MQVSLNLFKASETRASNGEESGKIMVLINKLIVHA
jgi:hypothetical protein